MSLSEYGEYGPKVYTISQGEYMVESPWGTAHVRVEDSTLRITLPDGQVLTIETWWAWFWVAVSIIGWVVYWILWWWASSKLDYNIITKIIGLLFPGLATIGEALIRK